MMDLAGPLACVPGLHSMYIDEPFLLLHFSYPPINVGTSLILAVSRRKLQLTANVAINTGIS